MHEDVIIFYMFSLHVVLLFVKMYFAYFLINLIVLSATPKKTNYMFIFKPLELSLLAFNLSFIAIELYFISGFFVNLELLSYESMAMLDEIGMTLSLMYILKKGGNNEEIE